MCSCNVRGRVWIYLLFLKLKWARRSSTGKLWRVAIFEVEPSIDFRCRVERIVYVWMEIFFKSVTPCSLCFRRYHAALRQRPPAARGSQRPRHPNWHTSWVGKPSATPIEPQVSLVKIYWKYRGGKIQLWLLLFESGKIPMRKLWIQAHWCTLESARPNIAFYVQSNQLLEQTIF